MVVRTVLAITLFSGLFAATCTQELGTFRRVKTALLAGNELQLTADAALCEASGDLNVEFASVPLRNWRLSVSSTPEAQQEVISSDDYYSLGSFDSAESSWLERSVRMFDDDSVRITIRRVLGNFQLDLLCKLGQGVKLHFVTDDADLVDIGTYLELKTRLLLGDHVQAVVHPSLCDSDNTTSVPDAAIGYQIEQFEINGDGTPDEALAFHKLSMEVTVVDPQGVAHNIQQVTILPDGSATLALSTLYADESLTDPNIFQCQLGTSLKFIAHERETEDTYLSYEAIKESTLTGHDMQLIVFSDLCEVLDGEPINAAGHIGSARYNSYQLRKPGSMWGDREYLSFTLWGLTVDGNLYAETANLYEDESLILDYYVVRRAGEIVSGRASCPLIEASLFHAISRTRSPTDSFSEIVSGVTQYGRPYEINVDYDGCELGSMEYQRIIGGIAWEATLSPTAVAPGGLAYHTTMATVVKTDLLGVPSLAWEMTHVAMRSESQLAVRWDLVDYFTGETLIKPGGDSVNCALAEAVVNGSVYFYRYP